MQTDVVQCISVDLVLWPAGRDYLPPSQHGDIFFGDDSAACLSTSSACPSRSASSDCLWPAETLPVLQLVVSVIRPPGCVASMNA